MKIAQGAKKFQFQIGPIGSVAPDILKAQSDKFQFQIGPIGRTFALYSKLNPSRFQFQIGPIGSRCCKRVSKRRNQVSIPDWSDWQLSVDNNTYHQISFQFQIGPIGRNTRGKERLTEGCFNSRLVRLAVAHPEPNPTAYKSFNSRLVRLAASSLHTDLSDSTSFNSRLVRLAAKFNTIIIPLNHVSIPDWSDWQFLRDIVD